MDRESLQIIPYSINTNKNKRHGTTNTRQVDLFTKLTLLALPANTNVPLDNPPSDNNVPVDNTTKITALDQLVDMKSWSKAFKIHAAIAAFVSMITFGSKIQN